MHGVEIDPGALEWAVRNDPKGAVTWHEGPVEGCLPELDGTVDVVVSNPPYIPLEAFEGVAPEARDHDPALALWSGEDGLDAMRVLDGDLEAVIASCVEADMATRMESIGQ